MLTRNTGVLVALLAASVLIATLPCSRHCASDAADLRSASKETAPADAPQAKAAPAGWIDDQRIGQLTHVQGVVVLRPSEASRWTPVAEGMPLKRGDWLRTDGEGPHAVSVRLLPHTDVILGPGAVGGTHQRAADPHRRRRRADFGHGKIARRGPRSPGGENLDFRGAALSGREPEAAAPGKRAPLASRSGREDRQGIDRLVAGQGGWPLRAVGRRLPQGVGGHSRPDRADDDRAVVRQPYTQRAGRHFLLSPAARRRACGLRHVDRRSLGRGRRGREAVGGAISSRPSSTSASTRRCWSGRAATLSRPACSRFRAIRRSGLRSATLRSCRCKEARIAISATCPASRSGSSPCSSWGSTWR